MYRERLILLCAAFAAFSFGSNAVQVSTTVELQLAMQSFEPIEVVEHLAFTAKDRLIFSRNSVNVAIWGNCNTPVPLTARSKTLVDRQRQVPDRACAITFEEGGFEFENIDSSPNHGYRRLLLSNIIFSSHAATPGYGIQATKLALWMSSVEWSGFSNLAIYDGAAYLVDVAFADNAMALSIGLGNRENSTAYFARKAVLSHVNFYNNQKSLLISDVTPSSAVTVVANNCSFANNADGTSFDLVLNVNLSLVVAGDFPYAISAPDAAGPYRIQRSDLNVTNPGTVAQPGAEEFNWLTTLLQAKVAGISRLLSPFGPAIYSEKPVPPEGINTDAFIHAPPPPYVAPPPFVVTNRPGINPGNPADTNRTSNSAASPISKSLALLLALLLIAVQL